MGLQPALPDQDFLKYRLESVDILKNLEHQLRGEVKVKGVWEQAFDRWLNEEGIAKILHIVYACGINKNVFLGNLTHDQINMKCNFLKKKIARLFFSKYMTYGIEKEMRGIIVQTVVNQIHSALSRCEMGREAEQVSTAMERHEVIHEGLDKKGGGSMINPANWFKAR